MSKPPLWFVMCRLPETMRKEAHRANREEEERDQQRKARENLKIGKLVHTQKIY